MRRLPTWYPVLLALAAAAASLAVFDRLPERMPIHFDFNGNPDGWASRAVGAFLPTAMILGLWGVLRFLPKIDPRRQNYERFGASYDLTVGALLTLLFIIHLLVLGQALGYRVPMGRVLPVLVGGLFLVIGNVLPRARSNFMYGIRTPWTLSSDRVWMRTHRLAGYMMALAGLTMIFTGVFLPGAFTAPLIVAALVTALAAPVVYSYFAWRQEQRS
jgi:uncharacterized membrane protein